MKKLMFASAVMAAGAALAIESGIVGYQSVENRQGNTLQVATFNTIGDEGFSIQDMIPKGDTVVGGGETTLQTLTKDKTTAHSYYWLTDDEWGTDCGEDGWFDSPSETEALSEKVFDPGEGFMFNSQNGTAELTFSGEVKYPVEIDVVQGNTICGNFWPINMSIQDITPSGDTTVGGGETTLQTFTKDKTTEHSYYWLTDDEWGTDCGEDGWFDSPSETESLSKKEFTPSEGYLFNSQNGPCTLSFPELHVKMAD